MEVYGVYEGLWGYKGYMGVYSPTVTLSLPLPFILPPSPYAPQTRCTGIALVSGVIYGDMKVLERREDGKGREERDQEGEREGRTEGFSNIFHIPSYTFMYLYTPSSTFIYPQMLLYTFIYPHML